MELFIPPLCPGCFSIALEASSENISRLVLETEHAIFSEQSSWMSSSAAKTGAEATNGVKTNNVAWQNMFQWGEKVTPHAERS